MRQNLKKSWCFEALPCDRNIAVCDALIDSTFLYLSKNYEVILIKTQALYASLIISHLK